MILHGFGASNSDFADMPTMLNSAAPQLAGAKRIGWVFPQAPVGAMGATAWWTLDPMKWMMAAQTGSAGIATLIREEPPGLADCREKMTTLVGEVRAAFGDLPMAKLGLAGFSQGMLSSGSLGLGLHLSLNVSLVLGRITGHTLGLTLILTLGAMTVMDLALHLDETVAGVTMLSGAPIVVEQWAVRLKKHKGIRVMVTHGMNDQVLPFAASGWTKQLLESGGAAVNLQTHSGGHELGDSATIASIMAFWALIAER